MARDNVIQNNSEIDVHECRICCESDSEQTLKAMEV